MKWAAVPCTLVAMAAAAHADNKDKADALFERGKQLMSEQRYAAACEAFESSQKLDPGIGAQLNIARCYEEWGKLGQAYLAYQAAEQAALAVDDERAPKIRERVVALEPDVPRLTIKVPPAAPADLVVTLDGKTVTAFDTAFVVDPGTHTIAWTTAGDDRRTKTVPIERGGALEVSLDLGPLADAGGAATDARDPAPARGHRQRLAGIALGGAGVLAIGVSSYMALSARGDYHDALDMYCGGMKDSCDATGLERTRDARTSANQATLVFVIGAALVGGGAALYVLAPKQGVHVAPALSAHSVGVVVGGAL